MRERDRREARTRDDAAFSAARRSNTIGAYVGYLQAWPSGAHVSEALRFLTADIKEFRLDLDSELSQIVPHMEILNELRHSLEYMSWEEERLVLEELRRSGEWGEVIREMETQTQTGVDIRQIRREVESLLWPERVRTSLEGLPNSAARRSAYRELSALQSTMDRFIETVELFVSLMDYFQYR